MDDLDWLLDLLAGDLDSAERKLGNANTCSSVLNLLAIKLLKHDYQDIIRITDKFLISCKDVDDTGIKLLEYRILGDIALRRPEDIIWCLSMLRIPLLIFHVGHHLPLALLSFNQLLDERLSIFLRRKYGSPTVPVWICPLSRAVCFALYYAFRNGLFDELTRDQKYILTPYLSIVFASISRLSDAVNSLKNVINVSDGYMPRAALGKIYFLMDNPTRSFTELQYALAFAERDRMKGFEARVNLAQLYMLQGDYRLALDLITSALRIKPSPFARLVRGEILLNMGRLNEATIAFKALINTTNKFLRIRALINLSICYLEKKNPKQAFNYLWTAYMLDPNDEYIKLIATLLKRYQETGG